MKMKQRGAAPKADSEKPLSVKMELPSLEGDSSVLDENEEESEAEEEEEEIAEFRGARRFVICPICRLETCGYSHWTEG